MDIMKPELMWIDGRCYRITHDYFSNFQPTSYDEDEVSVECQSAERNTYEEHCEDFEIDVLENGKFRTNFHIPRSYFAFIIGSKGVTRSRLENETKTQIRVPKQGQDGDIVITGPTRKGVATARRRINLIVLSARQKQPFTHFLSIPVTSKSIQEGFLQFKKGVLDVCGTSRGVESSIFQMPEKLHLTIGTMVLSDNSDRKNAADILQECKAVVVDSLFRHKPLKLKMIGIEYMNDDPAEVDVLYGKVESDNIEVLQALADGLVDYFAVKGVMQKQYEKVKLHVTLMNTLFREDKGGVSDQEYSKRKQKPRESFDASNILKIFENYEFGEQTVNCIHLSQRYSIAEDGYYKVSYLISLT